MKKRFNVIWTPEQIGVLDNEVEDRNPDGKPAHSTRANRSTVLWEALQLLLREQRREQKKESKPEDHPGWESFLAFWEASGRRGSRARAWAAWKAAWKDMPDLEIVRVALERAIAEWAGREAKFVPHFSTWIRGKPWESVEEEIEDEAPVTETDVALLELAAALHETGLPPAMATAGLLLANANGTNDVGDFLEGVELQMLRAFKEWAIRGQHREALRLRERHTVACQQRSAGTDEWTWEDFLGAAAKDPAAKAIVAEAFVEVLRSDFKVPKLEVSA